MATCEEFNEGTKRILRLVNALPDGDREAAHVVWRAGGVRELGRWASLLREIEEDKGDDGAAAHALDLLTACDDLEEMLIDEGAGK